MPTQLTTGDLVTAANWNTIPGGQVAYAQTTTNVGSITTSNVTLATVTPSFVTGRRIKLTGNWLSIASTVALDRFRFELLAAGVTRMQQIVKLDAANNENEGGTMVATFDSPSGSHPCLIRVVRHSGTGTGTVIASTSAPISILVEDVGAV